MAFLPFRTSVPSHFFYCGKSYLRPQDFLRSMDHGRAMACSLQNNSLQIILMAVDYYGQHYSECLGGRCLPPSKEKVQPLLERFWVRHST